MPDLLFQFFETDIHFCFLYGTTNERDNLVIIISFLASNKSQIAELEKEKKNADQDAAVSYTTQILSLQSDNAKNEYDIKAKNVEIKKLEASTKNAYVTL